ncbi:T9SS type A sorting domain-containing protein [uncultured Lacinutrix sp.]|uniref:T9SS type A sorting domain-containing protein n=1 Tax=uncultured Lacinutrix sp. TaxID=574032 RepID=UPI00260975D5|nr:T9SS type A sorting domain-containing protein [uncultured Lacinutrix sp.]
MKAINLLSITLLFSIGFGYGQTILSAGDIAITGFACDDPDRVLFICFRDIDTGTVIKFTDRGWILPSNLFRDDPTRDGTLTWTATTNLLAGEEIELTDTAGVFSANQGTVVETQDFDLSTLGDQILVYQGLDTSPTFIHAIHMDNANGGWSNAVTSSTSALPTGLTDTVNAIYMGEIDNGVFICSPVLVEGLAAEVQTQIADITNNWFFTNAPVSGALGGICTYNFCLAPTVWNGSSWSNGVPDTRTSVEINGDYNTSIHGDFSACSLIVNDTYTVTVENNNYIEVENDVTNNETIIVKTNGAFVQNNNNSSFTNVAGTSTVTKITAPAEDWLEYTYWSSPVSSETIGSALSPAATGRRFRFQAENFRDSAAETNNDNVLVNGFYDDEDDNGNDWLWLAGSEIMQPGIGYAATLSTTSFTGPGSQIAHTFSGEFNNGVIPVTIYRNDTETNDKNWNFIGNPYPSAISVADFLSENTYNASTNPTGTLDGALYLWSHENPPASNNNGNSFYNFNQSDYAMVNGIGGTAGGDNNGDGIVDALDEPNPYIPSGQGFFVEYHNMGSSTGSSTNGDGDTITEGIVTFNNSMRNTGNNNQFFRTSNSTNEANKLWLYLSSDTGVSSQILIGYINGATNSYDGAFYDATRNRSIGNNTFLFFTIENSDSNYAIQGKAPESLTLNEVIPIGLYTTITNPVIYTISISHFEGDFFNNNNILLKDNYNNVIHNLSSSNYNFSSNNGEFKDRFEIVFRNDTLIVDDSITSNNISIIELQNNNIKFTVPNSTTIKNIRIINVLGQKLYEFYGSQSSEILNLSNLSSAPYIAQITLSKGKVFSKKFIKK